MKILLGATLIVLSCGVLAERVLLDGVVGVIFDAILESDTEFAPGYTDAGFLVIQPGMTQQFVHRVLGKPLERWESSSRKRLEIQYSERWSRSPGGTNYHCRVVHYRDGRVVGKHSEFYVD